jgi:hypothetical protein
MEERGEKRKMKSKIVKIYICTGGKYRKKVRSRSKCENIMGGYKCHLRKSLLSKQIFLQSKQKILFEMNK